MKPAVGAALLDEAATSLRGDVGKLEELLSDDEIAQDRVDELVSELDEKVVGTLTVSRALLHRGQGERAETLLSVALGCTRREPLQEPIEETLKLLERASSPALNAALARWLSYQPTTVLLRFGAKLDPVALGAGAEEELGEILARLWREADEGESGEARKALALLGRCCREGASARIKRLAEEARGSFAGEILDEAGIERRRRITELLRAVAGEELLSRREASDILVEAANRMLVEIAPSDQAGALTSLVEQSVEWAAWEASSGDLEATREALEQSPWLPSTSVGGAMVRLLVEAALAQDQERPESPFDPSEMSSLAEGHRHHFARGVALWLERFDPAPPAAAAVLRAYFPKPLPSPLAESVEKYARRQRPAGRYQLVAGMIEWPSRWRPQLRLLRQLGIQGADPEKVTARIVGRFERANNHRDRQDALVIWSAFAPRDARYRRRLITEVFIPLAGMGVGGYELCSRFLGLCREPPRGTKGPLIEALSQPPDRQRGKQMQKRMKEMGLGS